MIKEFIIFKNTKQTDNQKAPTHKIMAKVNGENLVEIGCIECGVSTQIAGVYDTEEEADKKAETCVNWREGGQSEAEVFEIEV